MTDCWDVPVFYDPKLEHFADSRGIGPFKKIVVGPSFSQLAPPEQAAVVLHEVGHCKLRHLEKRLLVAWMFLLWPPYMVRLCHEHEYEADAYAAKQGFGGYLISLFERLEGAKPFWHPSAASRIERLRKGV